MSVYLPTPTSKTYIYDFWWQGTRYKDTTHCTDYQKALQVEANKRKLLRDQAAGLVPPAAIETPTFTRWAGVTLAYQTQFITRPQILERTLRMVLSFWGAQPTTPVGPAAVYRRERAPRPYHNLRLGDPIADPTWLLRFEQWMTARQISASTRNSYLSACSDLYTCAMQPQYRASTGISLNPFAEIRRSPPRTRTVALEPGQILDLVHAAARHVAGALCIAALAPKLRVASILALRWDEHFDAAFTTLTMTDHKTQGQTGLPQVVPISAQLRGILSDIRTTQVADAQRLGHETLPTAVIAYRGGPVDSIKKGLRRAVEAIGLPWGLADGVTFHVIRHSVATILANPELVGPLTERLRADVMGHEEIRTTQKYTHLNPSTQAGPHELLSAALPGLQAALTPNPLGGKFGGPPRRKARKPQQTRVLAFGAAEAKTGQNR